MGSLLVKKLRAMILSTICLLFSFQFNSNISNIDITPQLKNTNVEQIVEYEDNLYQHHANNSMSALEAKKRYAPKTKHI